MKQDIYDVSAIQRYPIGLRYPIFNPFDERRFYYCKGGEALTTVITTNHLHIAGDECLENNDRHTVAPARLPGDKTITVDVTVGFAGAFLSFQGGVVAGNELIGGFVEIWPHDGGVSTGVMWRRITANTAVVGGNITITVDKPLDLACGIDSTQVTIHPSIFRKVLSANKPGFQSAVCVPPVPVPLATPFFWGQTWGRCLVAPTGAWPGSVHDFRDVYLHSDGCIADFVTEYAAGANISPQRVGYAIAPGNYGVAEIMLQLTP